jgi:hypothetical protein
MNPFEEHADNMVDYQVELAEPINGFIGDFVVYAGAQIVAVVGHFVVHQVLVAGGFSPRLIGQAIIQKSALAGSAVNFATGQKLTVKQVGGSIRQCQIESIEDTFTEWRLNLWDKNESA